MVKQFEIKDENERVVAGWVSVEIKDLQGDIVPVEELERAMYKLMDRGGYIFYGHQNKPVGKILRWEVKEHPETGKPGLWVVAKIFNDYAVDDMVWDMIKRGKLTGFSIGGVGKSKTVMVKENGEVKPVNVITDIQLMEISLVEKPANPYARIEYINYFAKGEDIDEIEYFERRDDGWYAITKDGRKVKVSEEEIARQAEEEWKRRIAEMVHKLTGIEIDPDELNVRLAGRRSEQIVNEMFDRLAEAVYGMHYNELNEDEKYRIRRLVVDIADAIVIGSIIAVREGWFIPRDLDVAILAIEKGDVFGIANDVIKKVRNGEELSDVEKKVLRAVLRLAKMIKTAITKSEIVNAVSKGFEEIVELLKYNPHMPGGSFNACVKIMMERGYDEESAKRICGKIYWETEGKKKGKVEKESGDNEKDDNEHKVLEDDKDAENDEPEEEESKDNDSEENAAEAKKGRRELVLDRLAEHNVDKMEDEKVKIANAIQLSNTVVMKMRHKL